MIMFIVIIINHHNPSAEDWQALYSSLALVGCKHAFGLAFSVLEQPKAHAITIIIIVIILVCLLDHSLPI